MQYKFDELVRQNIWTLVSLPTGRKSIKEKWVYKIKLNKFGNINRFKSRWVVKGFQQKYNTNYFETFASVVRLIAYKILFALVAAYNLKCEQINVKSVFLNAVISNSVSIFV